MTDLKDRSEDKITYSTVLTWELVERLDKQAEKMRISRSAVVRLACEEWLEQKEAKP